MAESADLPDPAVSQAEYDREYFLECCAGAPQWRESGGRTPSGLYKGALAMACLREGETVVDIGTGRGELVAVAIEQGAARATGVDYSHAAVELARETLSAHDLDDRASVVLADARAVPLPDGEADLVTLLDVVEHLSPVELDTALAEALRLLRPGGRVFVHTMPNRLVYDVTYRVQRALWPPRWTRWPAEPRSAVERTMHVNEQTVRSMRRALRRAGFSAVRGHYGQWLHTSFVPSERARRLYPRLARRRLTAPLGACDLFAEATKPAR
ncbi:MAG: methyltransferase domain-containing protein [Thermoleophilaceae bacterium]|nr:methyltransferase domain-containing protein [Thermoleophilaceae bacterium]